MRINPQTVTLCTLERDEIRAGLELRRDALARTIARKREALARRSGDSVDRIARELDALEMKAARVADLLAQFADVAATAAPVTLGQRLMPGCTCGAAERGAFDSCRCD
jgi:hypothetical protein